MQDHVFKPQLHQLAFSLKLRNLNRAIIQKEKKKTGGKFRTPQTLPMIEAKDRIYTPMEIFHDISLTPR